MTIAQANDIDKKPRTVLSETDPLDVLAFCGRTKRVVETVIRVTPQPEPDDFDKEPDDFDKKVRKKGLQYLEKQGLNMNEPLSKGAMTAPNTAWMNFIMRILEFVLIWQLTLRQNPAELTRPMSGAITGWPVR